MPRQKPANNHRSTRSMVRPIVAGLAIILALVVARFAGNAVRAALEPAPHYALYVVNADGSGQKWLRDELAFDLWGPTWSPDGKQIAVSFVARSGDKGELYLLDSSGQNPTPLTHNGRNNYNPAWSHDGKQIVFHAAQLEPGLPNLIRENLSWIFVGIVGVIAPKRRLRQPSMWVAASPLTAAQRR